MPLVLASSSLSSARARLGSSTTAAGGISWKALVNRALQVYTTSSRLRQLNFWMLAGSIGPVASITAFISRGSAPRKP